jgi:hypothetical protein
MISANTKAGIKNAILFTMIFHLPLLMSNHRHVDMKTTINRTSARFQHEHRRPPVVQLS